MGYIYVINNVKFWVSELGCCERERSVSHDYSLHYATNDGA